MIYPIVPFSLGDGEVLGSTDAGADALGDAEAGAEALGDAVVPELLQAIRVKARIATKITASNLFIIYPPTYSLTICVYTTCISTNSTNTWFQYSLTSDQLSMYEGSLVMLSLHIQGAYIKSLLWSARNRALSPSSCSHAMSKQHIALEPAP